MPFKGLPGDEEANRLWHKKRFDDSYGVNADAKALYAAQPIWIRFAVLFPRIAFLLDNLNWIYNVLDVVLGEFRDAYVLREEFEWQRLAAPQNKNLEPFEYFNNYTNEVEQRACWLHLRSILLVTKGTFSEPLYRECAFDLMESARDEDRKMIVSELLSEETAKELSSIPVDMSSGIWGVRRQVAEREAMLGNALKRVRDALDASPVQLIPRRIELPANSRRQNSVDTDVEYGATPISSQGEPRRTRFSESPPRSLSPSISHRGRRRDHYHYDRSMSRDSMASSIAPPSSITTWAPEEPDHFTFSMKVWSVPTNDWVECIATMDTGCEGGNFISSIFLQEHLDMFKEIEEDLEAQQMELVDFGGNTDFKPLGKVKLRWYGRNISSGTKGKRTIISENWFRVAPHLPSETGEQPFQILFGKDWLHENEVFTYRGLRLFKSKQKKNRPPSPHHKAVLQHREQLRHEAEVERMSQRLASENASISTGHSSNSPKSSMQNLVSHGPNYPSPPNGAVSNGAGTTVNGHGVI